METGQLASHDLKEQVVSQYITETPVINSRLLMYLLNICLIDMSSKCYGGKAVI